MKLEQIYKKKQRKLVNYNLHEIKSEKNNFQNWVYLQQIHIKRIK